ncbi:hypothetical protein [uncultured Aquimarina sp.]|uniref:hypothetical protein n=1 Tax=uncultured Aquimarina sp. TaxID=575652 RepID=UPI00260451B0|nr:hypothetical protein [uncultured Aquimarina sp.]
MRLASYRASKNAPPLISCRIAYVYSSQSEKATLFGLMDKYGSDAVPLWLKLKCVF